ncbi:hypothetical protein [Paraburkholderia sp. BR14374]|uniref:hypothetical protein n=1 Tax=Paraburkholderia sp. BR14374 TaxID=3237007 RepID=UPI0034CEB7A6
MTKQYADRVVTIRLSSDTHRAMRLLAARNDMTVSSLFRAQAEAMTKEIAGNTVEGRYISSAVTK